MTRATPPASFTIALAAVLGLGPFAIDMYLASLPNISTEFAAPPWVTQLTLTGYLLTLGLGQLVAGPLTDAFGRRKPLAAGLTLFILGSVTAALAPSMAILVASRLLQGAGGAISFVVANSSVRDRTQGDAATRVYAALMTVSAVAPILAPALGGLIDQRFGWRFVFGFLAVIGAAALAVALAWLPESLPAERRTPLALDQTLRTYTGLARNGRFVLSLGALAGAFVVLFSYIGGASYVYQGHFGLGPGAFGVVFAVTGVSALIGPLAANVLSRRLGTAHLARLGVTVMVIGTGVALLGAWTGQGVGVVAAGIGLALMGLGVAEPSLMSLCMAAVTEQLGAAAALIGATQYLLGAVSSAVIAVLAASGPLQWTLPMVAISLLSLILAALATHAYRPHSDDAPPRPAS